MEWEERSIANYKFVDWGELKEGHTKEETIVIKPDEWIEGQLADIIYEDGGKLKAYVLKVDKVDSDVWIWANRKLNMQMGYDDVSSYEPVEIGQLIRISYFGKYTTKSGGTGYDCRVAVAKDTPKKK